jgi:DegV family protein with EDD domain
VADVAVVTDSTGYLPPALVESLGVEVVSCYYDLGRGAMRETEFKGNFGAFYDELVASEGVATTSPPTVQDFVEVYGRLLEDHRTIVSVQVSSALSETCAHARSAVEELRSKGIDGQRIVIIDSAGSVGHLAFQVLAAARAAAAGADIAAVVERVRQARQEVKLWFLVETLEFLRRSGRIGGAAAWIGSALDIKPILTVESEIRAVERVRTRKRGIERLVEFMRQRRSLGADRWFVQHANALEDARRLVERLGEIFGRPPEFFSEVGPVAGTIIGPGALWVGGLPGGALGGNGGG